MRTTKIILLAVATFGFVSIAHADANDSKFYDCALFDECETTASATDRGPTKGFSMSGPVTASVNTKPAVKAPVAATRPVARIAPAAPRPAMGAAPSAAAGVDLQMTFFSGSADLTPGARISADGLAAAMLRPGRESVRFMIEGHTDAVGNRAANLELSRRRAEAVVAYLADKGVDRSRFDVFGYGPDRPLPGLAAQSGANRRVVAKIIK